MKNTKVYLTTMGRIFLFIVFCSFSIIPAIEAQLSPGEEKAFDDFYNEILKVYRIVEAEDVTTALNKIEDLKPSIEKSARNLAEKVNENPDLEEMMESEEVLQLIQSKPYFKEMMQIVMNEEVMNKISGNVELQNKLDEVENMVELYVVSTGSISAEAEDVPKGMAFSINVSGPSAISGTYNINADFEEGALAFIDDLGYLRIEIYGDADGKEGSVSFFVDNKGIGRQEWETEGHFVFELMDEDGNLLISLYGSEGQGFFNMTEVDSPGGFVTGTIEGKCQDGNGEYEELIPIKAKFKAKHISLD